MNKLAKIIIAFILFFTFTLGLHLSMAGPQMTADCFMIGMEHQQSVVCDMTALEHLSYWQSLFVATLNSDILLILIVFAFSLLTLHKSLLTKTTNELKLSTDHSPPDYQLHIPLKLAYASGLISPKLCA